MPLLCVFAFLTLEGFGSSSVVEIFEFRTWSFFSFLFVLLLCRGLVEIRRASECRLLANTLISYLLLPLNFIISEVECVVCARQVGDVTRVYLLMRSPLLLDRLSLVVLLPLLVLAGFHAVKASRWTWQRGDLRLEVTLARE